MEAPKQRLERLVVVGAHQLRPVVFDLGDDLAPRPLCPHSPLGHSDELCAAVVRIGNAFDVAETLEVVDEVHDGWLTHLHQIGKFGDPRALVGDVLADRAVRGAKVGKAAFGEARADELVDREDRIPQERSDMARAAPAATRP